jgi:hypothetical protein
VTLKFGPITAALEQAKRQRADLLLRAATHEAGHLAASYLAGARVIDVNVALYDIVSRTRADVTRVDLVDVLVSYAAGAGALEVFGWPNPGRDTAHDAEQERRIADRLARGRRLDLEYRDAIIAAGREQPSEVVRQNWTAVLALADVLTKRYRLAGDELQEVLWAAYATVPLAVRPLDAQFEVARAALDRQHMRRDFRQRFLGDAPISKSPASPEAVIAPTRSFIAVHRLGAFSSG